MKKVVELIKNNSGRVQASLSTIVKIILIFSIGYAFYFHLWHILFVNALLLLLIFMPYLMKKQLEIRIPKEFEFTLLIFILLSFFLGEIRGLIIQSFFGAAMGFVGFIIMLLLYANSKIKRNYFLIILFSLCFSLALGVSAELLKFYLKSFLGYQIGIGDYRYAMTNLTLVALGSLLASGIGYSYMSGKRPPIINFFVKRFKRKNPNFFIEKTDSPEEVIELIKKGEGEKIEFKSTLRTNLHTGEHDRKIENSVLKAISSFLNAEGGVLLVGVTDSGEIIGIEKDNFQNNDKFNLHFTNLIKDKLGANCLYYINSELVLIEDKDILKVECRKSNKPVFLKTDSGTEEFYARIGPSSSILTGGKLLEYIKDNFER
jgi:hypothetical protein